MLNGITFTATEADAALQTLALAAHALDEAGYAAWLKANSAMPRTKRKRAARRSRKR